MSWRLIDYQIKDAFDNMAVDEAIFRETVKHNKTPTLRFYGWRPYAVSIGYFQELQNEINYDACRRSGVDVVRRLTGGKAVYHSNELTYSLAAANSETRFPDSISGAYEKISRCIARGLSLLGIVADLAPSARGAAIKEPDLASCCFSTPSGNELLADGRKICGSAQTRTRGGFLQHGALLMTFDPAATASLILTTHSSTQSEKLRRSVASVNELISAPVDAPILCTALKNGFEEELGIELIPGFLTPAEKELSEQLVKTYKSDAWNWERRKEARKVI